MSVALSRFRLVSLGLAISLFSCVEIRSSDFGVTGLIDIPTARMSGDGHFAATISRQSLGDIFNISYQLTPWAEGAFRYTVFNPRNYPGSRDPERDRSFEGKIRLLKERRYLPQVAVGVRDLIGTGVWPGEYLVASKKVRNLDITLGMGWGRFADSELFKNPLRIVSREFETRSSEARAGGALGGRLRGITFFRGPYVGIFGGFSYTIPKVRLKLLAEYNSDLYRREVSYQSLVNVSPWSYGFEWEPFDNVSLGFSRQQGSQIGLRLRVTLDAKTLPSPKPEKRYFSASEDRLLSGAPQNLDLNSSYDKMLFDVERSGVLLRSAEIRPDASVATLEISNESYSITADAIRRVLTIGEAHLPKNIGTILVLINEDNLRLASVDYTRKNELAYKTSNVDRTRITILPPRRLVNPTNTTDYNLPRLIVGADVAYRVQIMDPDTPLKQELFVKISGRMQISDGWNIWGVYAQNLYDDFDNVRKSDSVLPRVRSNLNYYLTEGSNGVDSLFLEKRGTLLSTVHYRAYAGILEEMFTGVGGEVFYQPFRSRLAVGLSSTVVQQREYDRGFGLRDYKTTTRFIHLYYASPIYNLDFALNFGRYLAKDKGITLDVRRTFDNGFSVGAFVTFTNISAEQFGEGSFDKGIYFRIPYAALLPGNTRRSYSTIIRPLERDGGRRLEGVASKLWWDLRTNRYDALDNNIDRMIPR